MTERLVRTSDKRETILLQDTRAVQERIRYIEDRIKTLETIAASEAKKKSVQKVLKKHIKKAKIRSSKKRPSAPSTKHTGKKAVKKAHRRSTKKKVGKKKLRS